MKNILLLTLLLTAIYCFSQHLDTPFGTNGRVEVSFNNQGDSLSDLIVQPDGKIVGVGWTRISGYYHWTIFRLNSNGSLDPTFGTGGKITGPNAVDGSADAVALQTDGKILVAGNIGDFHFKSAYLYRYNPDGSIDSTFGTSGAAVINGDTLFSATYSALAVQPDGRILVGGVGITGPFGWGSNPQPHLLIHRYHVDGSLDTTFHIADVPYFSSYEGPCIRLQPNGKIVTNGVWRFNADGSIDSTFGTNGLAPSLVGVNYGGIDVQLQANGGILAHTGDGTQALRLSSQGIRDSTFGINAVSSGTCPFGPSFPSSILILPDGSFLASAAAWDSTSYYPVIVRYDSSGNIMNSFGYQGYQLCRDTFRNIQGYRMVLNPSGHVVAGTTSTYEGRILIYLYKDLDIPTGTNDQRDMHVSLYPNPSDRQITVQAPAEITAITVSDMMGRLCISTSVPHTESYTLDVNDLNAGSYIISISADGSTCHSMINVIKH